MESKHVYDLTLVKSHGRMLRTDRGYFAPLGSLVIYIDGVNHILSVTSEIECVGGFVSCLTSNRSDEFRNLSSLCRPE